MLVLWFPLLALFLFLVLIYFLHIFLQIKIIYKHFINKNLTFSFAELAGFGCDWNEVFGSGEESGPGSLWVGHDGPQYHRGGLCQVRVHCGEWTWHRHNCRHPGRNKWVGPWNSWKALNFIGPEIIEFYNLLWSMKLFLANVLWWVSVKKV